MLTPEQEARLAMVRRGNPNNRIPMAQRATAPVTQPTAPTAMGQPMGQPAPQQVKVAGAPAPMPQSVASSGAGPVGPSRPPQGPTQPSAPAPGIFDGLDDKTAQMLMGLGDKERQMRFAEMLRDQGAPQGRHINQGRTYVASSPLEHAATAYQRFRGKRDADRIGEEQTQGRLKILDLLRGR